MGSVTVRSVPVRRLTPEAFAPFGQVIGPGSGPAVTMRTLLDGGTVRFGRRTGAPPEGFDVEALDILHLWDPELNLVLAGKPPSARYMVTQPRPLEFHLMERHLYGSQTFIPLAGTPSVFAVAPPTDPDDPEALPDPDEITAFLLDGTLGVNIDPGTWHWTPIPVGAAVTFVTFTREGNRLDDLWYVDLQLRFGLRFELILPDGAATP